jgi:hypothetical protein
VQVESVFRAGRALLLGCALACSSGGSEGERTKDPGGELEPYFDGMTLDGFELVGVAASDLSIENGVLHCDCPSNGYFYKPESYRNFDLELEFRYERPAGLAPGDDLTFSGNSGVFVYLAPPHGVWPSCLEIQGAYQETGDIFRLPGLSPGNDAFDPAALTSARRPVGEWNTLSVHSNEGALKVELNGVLVNQSTPTDLSEGIIALESEGAPTEWRNVRVRRLP